MNLRRCVVPGPLGIGGGPLGDMFEPITEDTAAATVAAAWGGGIRYFDVAPHYGTGLAEHRLGLSLRHYPRNDFVLSTKVGRLLIPNPEGPEIAPPFASGLAFQRRWDYTAAGTRRAVEDSLQRLGVGRIDIVFVHDLAPDHHPHDYDECFQTAAGGAFPELIRMREEGQIQGWGLGVNVIEPCLRTLKESDPDVFLLAGRYTLLDCSALQELLPACAARGVGVVIGGPYNSGLLAGGKHFNYVEADQEHLVILSQILEVCRKHRVDLKAAALQFCAAHPAVACVIPGANHPDQVRENIALMKLPIPADFWAALKSKGLVPAEAPTPMAKGLSFRPTTQ